MAKIGPLYATRSRSRTGGSVRKGGTRSRSSAYGFKSKHYSFGASSGSKRSRSSTSRMVGVTEALNIGRLHTRYKASIHKSVHVTPKKRASQGRTSAIHPAGRYRG